MSTGGVVAGAGAANGCAAAATVARRHLDLLGLSDPARAVEWRVDWHAPADPWSHGSEATCQALAGLMALHGAAAGDPRRLGLDVASSAAGVLAVQGVLAALVVRARGGALNEVRTSALQGALMLAGHRLAVATGGGRATAQPGGSVRPPFPTADGHRAELEAVSFDAWRGLFLGLGASEQDIDAGWGEFARRYVTGRCALPPALHEATRLVPLARLEELGARHGVAVCHIRSCPAGISEGAHAKAAPWTVHAGDPAPVAGLGTQPPSADRPLADVRVVELTTRLQGPLAGHLLRMLGADVVKVEPPGGDPGRMAPAGPFRVAYLALNRGKRFAEVDYKTAAGLAELHDLVAGADVFLHNTRPGRVGRLGIDFDSVRRANPSAIHAQLAGWDPDGPRASEVAGDYVVQADTGLAFALTEAGDLPSPSPVTLLDVMAGLLACEGILAGLLHRATEGRGSGTQTTLPRTAAELQRDAGGPPVWGPLDRPISTPAGRLVVSADDDARRELSAACGARPDASADSLATRLAERGADDWEKRLGNAGVPAARVREDLAALPADPRVRDLLEPLDDAGWAPAPPWSFAT